MWHLSFFLEFGFGFGLPNSSAVWLRSIKLATKNIQPIFAWIKPKINIYDDCVLYGAFGRSVLCVIYGLSYASRLSFVVSTFCSNLAKLRYNRQSPARFIPFIIHVQQRYRCKIECWPAKTTQRPMLSVHTAHSNTKYAWLASQRWQCCRVHIVHCTSHHEWPKRWTQRLFLLYL